MSDFDKRMKSEGREVPESELCPVTRCGHPNALHRWPPPNGCAICGCQGVESAPCEVAPACNGGKCPCGVCHGSGWHYAPDPSGETESFFGEEPSVRLLEKYCDCPIGDRRMAKEA